MISAVAEPANPYVIGVPIADPRSLFGRQPLIDFVRDNLAQGAKAILLSGQRRMGKSSVLRQIPLQIQLPNVAFVPFDLQAKTNVPLGELLHAIAEEIGRTLSLESIYAPTVDEIDANREIFIKFVQGAVQAAGGRSIILLLDEFDALGDQSDKAAAESFFPYLKNAIDREINLGVVAVIGRRLDQLPQLISLFRGAPHQEIGLLNEAAARRQIVAPSDGHLNFEPEAVDAILALSAGHPYFTQVICHVLFQGARDEKQWRVTGEEVRTIVPAAITAGEAGLSWFLDGLEIPERAVFSAIAELGEAKARARAEEFSRKRGSARKTAGMFADDLLESYGVVVDASMAAAEARLVQWGFVRETEDARGERQRTVTVELVRRWLLEKHAVRWEIFELDRVVPQAAALYEDGQQAHAAGDFPRAQALWERALELNPNHLHALGELAEAYLEDGRFDRAIEYFDRAYRTDTQRYREEYLQALTGHARDLTREHRYAPARGVLETALAISPNNSRLLQRLEEANQGVRREIATRNPFYVGSGIPAAQFAGRSDAISEIVSAGASGGHLALFGPTGMGKTSLLQYVAAPGTLDRYGLGGDKTTPVYIDCQSLAPFTPVKFWQKLQDELARARGVTPSSLGGVKRLFGRAPDTSGIQRLAAEGGRSMLLLLDEFERALEPNENFDAKEIAAFYRDLSRGGGLNIKLSVIAAAHRRFAEPNAELAGSPVFNVFKVLPLRAFNEQELAEITAKMPVELAPLSYEENRWIRTVTGGYPYLTEAAMALLFRLRTTNRPFDARDALQQLSSETESFLAALWQGWNTVERAGLILSALLPLARRLPDLKIEPGPPGEESVLPVTGSYSGDSARELEDTGILRTRPDGVWEVAGSLLEWWVMRRFFGMAAGELSDILLAARMPKSVVTRLISLSKDQAGRVAAQNPKPWALPLDERGQAM